MALNTKRKNNYSHYDDNFKDNFNDDIDNNDIEYISDRIKSKRLRIDTENNNKTPEICIDCGYGKIGNICRCTINTNNIILDNNIIKLCTICENSVSVCECPISIWTIFQCGICRISHSVFDKCNLYITCVLCNKNRKFTDIGCRCIHGDIKYIYSCIDTKCIYVKSDYIKCYDKLEYQPICIHCGNHLSICKCVHCNSEDKFIFNSENNLENNMDYNLENNLEDITDYNLEEIIKDEYEQMYYD